MTGRRQTSGVAQAMRVLGPCAADGPQALQAAFRAAVKASHPDAPGGDAARFRGVVDAHRTLKSALGAGASGDEQRLTPPTLEISPAQAVRGGTHVVRAPDGRRLLASLPAGLRAGMTISVAGRLRRVAIVREDGASVAGDDLSLSVSANPALMRRGGVIAVETPVGPRTVRLPPQDLSAFVVRAPGAGLPARFGRPQGDLLVHVRAAAGHVRRREATQGLAA